MNRYTQLDEILQELVPWQPHEVQRISRSQVKGQGHRTVFSESLPLRNSANKFVSTITHEPLHSAWWYFAWTCTSTTTRTLLNIKVVGHFSVSGQKFPNLFSSNVEKSFSACWLLDPFQRYSRSKSRVVLCCTKLAAIVHAQVLRQPREPCWI